MNKTSMTTPEGVTIEVHRKPPADWKGTGKNIGHLRAVGPDATVVMPCSLSLLDDPELVDHYVKSRLLHFYKLEADRSA